MSLELVISDLDGTIVETEDYHRRAYNALFAELGLEQRWSKQDYSERLTTLGGGKFREIFAWLERPEDEFEETKRDLYDRKTKLYVSLIGADLRSGVLPLRPGVARLFEELRAERIPLAIGTACVKWAAIEVIRASLGDEFLHSLATISAGDDVSRKKPHPDIYLLAASVCGASPEHCLVLEDTAHGVQAALAAGMTCVATPSELALADDFSGAHLVAESLEAPGRVGVGSLRDLFPSGGEI